MAPSPTSASPVVRLADADGDLLTAAAEEARAAVEDLPESLRFARALGDRAPLPGGGSTAAYLSVLATIAAVDLTVARVVEPHLDALAILDQAGLQPGDGVYGVYAAERPGLGPVATAPDGDLVRLSGTKPWCSLAGTLDRALLTAGEGEARRLYDLDLHDPGAAAVRGTWASRGLVAVDSGDLRLTDVPASPVGAAGWYLRRPGFAWGGIGGAACWCGGAAALAAALGRASEQRAPDQLALAAIGEADRLLWSARGVLEGAAARIDRGAAVGADGALLAARVRGVVADAAERVLVLVGHALGPAPLTFDEQHARRVADLTVYLRQHHAARDDAAAGRAVLATSEPA